MQSFRSNRRIALLAVAALLFATTAYLAHGDSDSVPSQHGVQCDLCLQFNGTAGAPDSGGLVGKPPLVAYVPLDSISALLPARRKVGLQLPRAPPAHSVI